MESTLALKLDDLSASVGVFLGYGRGANFGETAWTTNKQNVITECVKSGLRQFYWPPPLEGERSSYEWSFLKPTATLALASGESTTPLPDDFGGFEGELTLQGATAQQFWPVQQVGEGVVRANFARTPTTSGRPLMVAVVPLKGTTPTTGQRFQLYFYPLSDGDYTVSFQYRLLPDYLTNTSQYAYGGAIHAETILVSCLAVAEKRFNDAVGVKCAEWAERLAASVNMDRQYKPQSLGYNADQSDGRHLNWFDRLGGVRVTYMGVLYAVPLLAFFIAASRIT